jgi:hypothetical protein
MFNKYEFIEDLKTEIQEQIKQNENFDFESYIFEQINNEIIYYNHCFEICKTLFFTDFDKHEYGPINNICSAAFCALYDLCIEEGIFNLTEQN